MDKILSGMAQFHFLRPEWFLALVPVVALIILLWNRRSAYGSWQQVIAPHLLQHLLEGSGQTKNRAPLIFLLIAWILAVIALAGPTWKKLPQAVQKKVNAQVIVLDLSLSMYAQDVSPSRLERARFKLSDILKRSNEGLTGLVVFAGTPHVVTPLTDDTRTILSMVDSLSPDIMPIPGSDPAAAVIKAREVLEQGGMYQGHIILLTDDLPANFADEVRKEINPADTPVSIFAIGTSEGSPISLPGGNFIKDSAGSIVVAKVNEGTMKTAARQLGGRFTTLTYSDEDIDYLLGLKANLLDQEMKETERDFDTWDEMGYWLVFLLLPLAAAGYRKGWLGGLLLPLVAGAALYAPQQAHASLWEDLWQTPDQQGQQAWRKEQYQSAAEKFEDPMWKGSALYRSEKYEEAAEEFARLDTADSHYNRGNALARQQKIQEAIEAYETALEKDPDMEDAKKNLELLKQMQQEQEQQQGDQKNNQGDQESEQEDAGENQSDESEKPSGDQQDQNQQGEEQPSESGEESDQQQKSGQQNQQEQDEQQEGQDPRQQDDTEPPDETQQQPLPDEESPEGEEQQAPRPIAPRLQESKESAEDQQALQQWLERVPDEPGGLLRRKFKMESKLRNQNDMESQAW
ncbi:MAG: VWA domain-containing protein [Ketobacteraceae bacterium]|nr:VWA domain-containing protein [Ketobacteraceae bacterium]